MQHRRFSNAYYLAGYTIEIGLKACIAAQVSAETIPDKVFLREVLKHDFRALVGLAGLATALKEQQDKDPLFAVNWTFVSEWLPDARYETKDATTAQTMIAAIIHPTSGFLPWIKIYW